MNPLVSICMPCHNAEKYVGEAVESVLNQTYQNIELIVVNDGSTDRSGEVLERYRRRGVKTVTENCGSASKARNRAFKEAKGKYIKFFDADDLLSPKMIKKQIAKLNGRTDAVASSEWGRFYGKISTFKSSPQSVWRDMKSTDWLVEAWHDAQPMMQPGMFLIPKTILEKAGYWNEQLTLTDDFEYFSRVICKSKEVLFAPEAVLYYRSGIQGNLSGQTGRRAVESHFTSILCGTSHLLSLRNDRQAKLSCGNILQEFIYTYYPDHSDLRNAAAKKIKELGGSNLKYNCSPLLKVVQKTIGWKNAKRLKILLSRKHN